MSTRQKRAREIQLEIARILLEEWDPIGVKGVPEAADEYDGYVGGVYRLLTSSPSPHQVADHLYQIEVDRMGLGTATRGAEHLLPTAESLIAIDVGLEKE